MDKDIERLYQDKFEDFEVLPDAKVWAGIEESLHKKKRRVFPIWWFTGVAAILMIGLLLFPFGSGSFNNDIKEDTVITGIDVISNIDSTTVVKSKSIKILPNNIDVANNVTNTKKNRRTIKKTFSINVEKKSDGPPNIAKVIGDPFLKDKESVKDILVLKNDQSKTILKTTKGQIKEVLDEEFLVDAKDLDILQSETNKWSIIPSVAFLSSGSLSKGSSISKSLKDNPLEGTRSHSYGVKISYKINDNWEFESGVHMQEIGFNTKNVVVARRSISSTPNIDFMDNTINFNDSDLIVVTDDVIDKSSEVNVLLSNTSINQSIGYLEFPIEMKYTVFNKSKVSTQVVMGFSTLLLNKNEISTVKGNSFNTIGKADNLNKVNFSGNVGLDINYKLSKKLKLILNPMFKVDLNTFSQNSNGFKPYSIGVCSGVKYQF